MPAAKESRIERLGLIAGGGSLPGKLLHACDRQGIDVFVVGLEGQIDDRILKNRRHLVARPGAAGKIIETFRANDIRDLVLIGSVRRPSLKELKPDLRTAKFFARIGLRALGDDGILKALRGELEQEGFVLHGVQEFIADLLVPEGPVGRYRPDKADRPDIERGVSILQGIGSFDIGQALVIQEGIVLGVEAAEGTDELIRRCEDYARDGRRPILVKLAKPGQDQDLDLPTIGPETVRICAAAGIGGIVIHAGKSLLLEPETVTRIADEHRMFVIGIDPEKSGA